MLLTILIALIGITIVGLVVYMMYSIIDESFLSYKPVQAKVVGKMYNPAYTKTYLQPIMIGKTTTLIPMKSQSPERFCLEVEVNEKVGLLEVTKKDYIKIQENELVNVKYAMTRFTKKLQFKGK